LHVAHMNNALQLSLQGIVFRASDRRQSIDTDCHGRLFALCPSCAHLVPTPCPAIFGSVAK
jgi:hypothetical protein